jgi:preprotein translocase subunit SecG
MVVLIQKPKGGGIASNFAGGSQFMGVKKTNDVIEKTTWILSLTLFVLALAVNFWIPRDGDSEATTVGESKLKGKIEALPVAPNAAPKASQPAASKAQPAADTTKK